MAWTAAAEVIAAWIGDDAPSDTVKVENWIDKAERLLRSRVTSLQERLAVVPAVEPDLLGNVKDIVTDMVHEVFRNPERIRQRQEGTGPFTGSVTYGGDKPGSLRVTDEQLALISLPGSNRGAFTVDTIPVTSPYSPNYVWPDSEVWP
jgi:hypothetical protein